MTLPHQVSRHRNGLTLLTAEMPHMASVSVGIWVGVGGRYEPAALCGVSHFIEHMLFKGTRQRTARQISQDVEGIGGYLNAFTAEETTCFYSKARHDRFDELFDVLMDMFVNSRFERGEIEKERNVIKEELAMYQDQPQHQVQEALNELLWPGQPLGRPLTGTVATLDFMQRPHLTGYQRQNYLGANTVISAAGNLKRSSAVKAANRLAEVLSAGKRPVFAPASSSQTAPCVRLITKATEQTQMALGVRSCSRHDERRYALRVLNTILGENMSSRLFQVVREDRGLAYNVSSGLAFFDDAGMLNISAGVETDKLPETIRLVMRELKRLADGLVSPAELRRARDYVTGQIELGLENTENVMNWLAEHWLAYGKVVSPEDAKQRLREVRASDIRAVARDIFKPERVSLALVSPRESDQGLAELLNL